MAEVPYTGSPSAAPQTDVPNDFQHIEPTAAEGLSQFGAGASQAGQFFGQAAADDQTNNVLSGASKLLYGDPTKTVMGPDGQAVPDTGFFGLKGRQALDARPQTEADLDNLIKTARGNLTTPEQQLQFDNFTRRYRTSLSMDIGRFTDQQSVSWYGDVNTATAQNAINGITQNAGNPDAVANFSSDLINARVKEAQLAGAQPGDAVYQSAVTQAKAEAAKTQITAVGATDPGRALKMIGNYQGILGGDYGPLLEHFQQRGDQKIGQDFVANYNSMQGPAIAAAYAASPSNPTNPTYTQVASTIPGGMTASGLARTVQIESGGKDVTNASGHVGYGQFSSATWAQYGNGGNPHDFGDSVAAIQRYAIDNAKYLSGILGRAPTDAELYLAHQQGGGGAAKLLANPNASAASLIGAKAVVQNGGAADMTAQQFVSMWTHKFNGTTPTSVISPEQVPQGSRAELAPAPTGGPAGMESVPVNGIPTSPDAVATPSGVPLPPDQASAAATTPAQISATGVPASPSVPQSIYQAIQNDPTMNAQQKQYAFAEAERQAREQALAEDQTAAQQKQANDAAANEYVGSILKGNFPSMATIANDNRLTADGKKAISDMMLQHADESVTAASQAYGPGYWNAYKQILAPAGDPSRISDPVAILRMGGPGGSLTGAGVQKALGILADAQKPEGAAIQQAKASMISYAKSRLSFQVDGDPNSGKDPEGEMIFGARFIPKFEAAYEKSVVQGGEDPFKFLSQPNVDSLIAGLRNPREMALSRLEAQATGGPIDTSQLPAPPEGVDPQGWRVLLSAPLALRKDGTPWPSQNWGAAVQALAEQPSETRMQQFNQYFGSTGIHAQDVLSVLGITPHASPPDERSNPAPPPTASADPAYNPITDPRMGLGPLQ